MIEGVRSHGTCSAERNLRRSRAPGEQASQTPTAARQNCVLNAASLPIAQVSAPTNLELMASQWRPAGPQLLATQQ